MSAEATSDPGTAAATDGIVMRRSSHSFAETAERLEQALESRSIAVFCRIDHSGEASKAGLVMPRALLVIFGSPRAGTPLMLESPSLALDLPLKALIAEDDHGVVWVTSNSPEYLRRRHALASPAPAFAAVDRLLEDVAAPGEQP